MWRPDQLLGEALRNLGTAHRILGVVIALVLAGVSGYVILQADRALNQEEQLRAAGSLVWVATATDETVPLSGAACTRAGAWPGVAVAGGLAVRPSGPLYAYHGGLELPVQAVTPGAVQVFLPEAPWAMPTVGAELVQTGQVGAGQWLLAADGSRAVRPEYQVEQAPVSVLTSNVTTTVLADTPVSTCWVRMQPGAVSAGGDVLAAAFPGGTATIARFLPEATGVLTPAQQWQAALALQPWLIGGLMITAAVLLVSWSRRSQLAVYRTFGTPRTIVMVMLAAELVLVALPAVAAAVLAATITAAATGVPLHVLGIAARHTGAALLIGTAASTLLVATLLRGSLTETLRDR
ncbi:MAG TPA: hypothetical protein VK060_10965 [Ruania sp.]|nr:hypothetical protein [Ruania sp.]